MSGLADCSPYVVPATITLALALLVVFGGPVSSRSPDLRRSDPVVASIVPVVPLRLPVRH